MKVTFIYEDCLYVWLWFVVAVSCPILFFPRVLNGMECLCCVPLHLFTKVVRKCVGLERAGVGREEERLLYYSCFRDVAATNT